MQFQYVLDYRDEADAQTARFPGESTVRSVRSSWPAAIGIAVCAALIMGLVLLFPRDTRVFRAALIEADRNSDPVFVWGIVIVAIGGALCVCPTAYAVALRRARRPVHAKPVTIRFDDAGVTLVSPDKELSIAWSGVVAAVELRSVFVLKTVTDLRLVLPKRACETSAAVNAVSNLLRMRVVPLADAAPQELGMAA